MKRKAGDLEEEKLSQWENLLEYSLQRLTLTGNARETTQRTGNTFGKKYNSERQEETYPLPFKSLKSGTQRGRTEW